MKVGSLDIGQAIMLAPMEEVTDRSFRKICKRFGADVVYTEFISAEAIRRQVDTSLRKMRFDDDEAPVVVQIFGNSQEAMAEAAVIAASCSPAWIDINFGCPAKKVAGKGAGAALLKEPDKMVAIAAAVVRAVNLPVTVKTRLGWDRDSINIVDIVPRLEDVGVQALAIHGRTRSEMYRGVADWEWIRKVTEKARIPVIANGDIWSAADARAMFAETGADAVMIGRGAIGNPFIFAQARELLDTGRVVTHPDYRDRIAVAVEHLKLSVEFKGEKYGSLEMRRHYSTYLKGLPRVSRVRDKLVREPDWRNVIEILQAYEVECEGYEREGKIRDYAEFLNDHSKRLTLNY
ncbi:TIM-barrel protein, nifR3 family [Prosthecochloris aestuarii DSM 271]|uniref:tRNA-dihydrouridine synthase n=1 Tax=Prosthecochloris aestuarii (strain DSM 271 / SK 413) TaxID=290512 RepID=B4S4R6_PROA2|nr:tRNA dihydrouridine synthase DusB [Prosthecochloris aestuarii]ACF46962.1 TIM-barrel protein, nifR3 family [Prosthecochloris aestuarii DSM 271]